VATVGDHVALLNSSSNDVTKLIGAAAAEAAAAAVQFDDRRAKAFLHSLVQLRRIARDQSLIDAWYTKAQDRAPLLHAEYNMTM